MRRSVAIISAVAGIAFVGAAGVTRFVVAPSMSKLKSDTDVTRVYEGIAPTILNPAALAPGSTEPFILQNVPVRISHHVKVVDSNGDAAVVQDSVTATAAGKPIANLVNYYAVDRKDLGESKQISASNLTAHRGLTFSFPIGTEKKSYTGWVRDTQTNTTIKYEGTEQRGGIETYKFSASVAPTKITDAGELAQLPRSVPKAAVGGLLTKLGVAPAVMAQLAPLMASLPEEIPLSYMFSATSTYWVAPADGLVVDVNKTETRALSLPIPASALGLSTPIATSFTYTDTAETLATTVDEAKQNKSDLQLINVTVPLILLIVGILFLAMAAFMWWRGPRVITLDGAHGKGEIPGPRESKTDVADRAGRHGV